MHHIFCQLDELLHLRPGQVESIILTRGHVGVSFLIFGDLVLESENWKRRDARVFNKIELKKEILAKIKATSPHLLTTIFFRCGCEN